MYSREDALKIKDKVERDGVFLWKKDMNIIIARELEFYLYGNEEERNKHIKRQKEAGWKYEEIQNYKESLHTNFFKDNQDVLVYVAYFERALEPVKWDK